MFYYVKGPVAHIAPYLAVIDCGGVGYACHTTANTLSYLKKGEVTKLYTYLHVREELFDLYGFSTEEERSCFELLIGVSGVGPKAALSILSATSPEGLAMSIITGDEKALTVAQGIGKKIAQRIILELKDKLAKSEQTQSGNVQMPQTAGGNVPKAIEALGVLGYTPADVSPVLANFDASLPVEQLIAMTLKQMGRN